MDASEAIEVVAPPVITVANGPVGESATSGDDMMAISPDAVDPRLPATTSVARVTRNIWKFFEVLNNHGR